MVLGSWWSEYLGMLGYQCSAQLWQLGHCSMPNSYEETSACMLLMADQQVGRVMTGPGLGRSRLHVCLPLRMPDGRLASATSPAMTCALPWGGHVT